MKSSSFDNGQDNVGVNYRDDPLWHRILAYGLDDPDSEFPFSLRLARENGWSRHYTSRTITEYKRFCYLTLTTDQNASPSDAVDQVWHLHLIYSKSYWEDFCGGVLRRPFHHSPSRGGRNESLRFNSLYKRTLESYVGIYGVIPPEDIWPNAERRFALDHKYCRIDLASSWVIPKPWHLAKFKP